MTKEDWLEIRTKPEMPMDFWFSFYKERGGTANEATFEEVFTTLLAYNATVTGTDGEMKQMSLATATHAIHRYYNQKFGI